MATNVDLSNPAQKRLEAENIRKGDTATGNEHLARIIKEINEAPACATTTPVVVFGVRTSEYCIVRCPERDDTALEIIQRLEGRGYYVSRFRVAKIQEGKYTDYAHALLVVWDRRVLRKSVMPRYYTVREKTYNPCGNCYMQSRNPDGIKTCQGCEVLAMWLCGVNALVGKEDPCVNCKRTVESKGRPVCSECPARRIWREQNPDIVEAERAKITEDADDAGLMDAAAKSANAPSAKEDEAGADTAGANEDN